MKAFCLSLDSRKEHWIKLKNDALQLNIEMENFVVGDGIKLPKAEYDYIDIENPDTSYWGYGNPKYKKNHYNAFIAHHHIINRVKEQNLPYFLMMEDDAYFTSRFEFIFKVLHDDRIIDELTKDGCLDILYLGWWIGDENDDWNVKIEQDFIINNTLTLMKAKQIGGLHGAIISEKMYDLILSMKPINPIDCQLNQIHNKINSWVLLPKIIHTKTMYSNCEGSVIERKVI